MEMILGKEAQYHKNGKLKNDVIRPKYTGDLELENILEDMNWIKVGACEIRCISVLDTDTKKQDAELMTNINDRIKSIMSGGEKPKTEIELLKEQNALLMKQIEMQNNSKPEPVEASEERKALEGKANELNIKFRANIGDVKLLEKIQEIEPEFTV